MIVDEKSTGTNGGQSVSGNWQDRDLNTIKNSAGSDVTLSNNEFTVVAGKYVIHAQAPAVNTQDHMVRIYNVTDSIVESHGTSSSSTSSNDKNTSDVYTSIDITSPTTYKIQHYTDKNRQTGLGRAAGINGAPETYTIVGIYKVGPA